MSFKSQVGKVNAGLAAGSFKKADPDPYGFQGFAEQVTFGIRAEADAKRKEDFLKKQEESAIRKERAKLQQAKEASDLKIKGYITRAMGQVTSGYSGAPTNAAGLAGLNSEILTAVTDMGITTYKGVLGLLEGSKNFQSKVNSFYDPVAGTTSTSTNTSTETGSSTNSSSSGVDTSVDTGGSSTVADANAKTSGKLDFAASQIENESSNLFGNSNAAIDLAGLSSATWEEEIQKRKQAYELTPNKFPTFDEDIASIREFASSKGWVSYGGITPEAIRSMTSADLLSEIAQLQAGIGPQVTPADITKLEEFVTTKKEIEEKGSWWNSPEDIFTRLSKEDDRAVVDAQVELWSLLPSDARSTKYKNVVNAISIFDHVQSGKPLDDTILEKMVGADVGVIEGLKAVYGERANAQQKLTIEKLISLANEKDTKDRKPKDIAFTSWSTRTGLAEKLDSLDLEVRKKAEQDIANWEKIWSKRTSIAQQSKEWWEDAKNLSKMSLEEVDLLLDSETITQANNAPAYAALLRLKPTLDATSQSGDIGDLDSANTTNLLSQYAAQYSDKLSNNPELQKVWRAKFAELRKQESAEKAAEDLDPMEIARRAYISENGLDAENLTFQQTLEMEVAIKKGTTVVDDSDPIIEGSDLFRLPDGQYVRRTKSGKLRNTFTNAIVEVPANTTFQPVSVEIQNQIDKQFTRLRDDVLTPMSETQKKSLGTIRSAKRLSDMANANPEVLNIVGDLTSILGRLKITTDVFNSYLDRGLSTDQFAKEVSGGIDSEKLVGSARAKALFDAEVLKYAYLYASVNLEQSGRGLSDTDFKQALRQVNAGTGGLEAFDKNIRKLTKETYSKVRGGIETAFGSTETTRGANTEIIRLENLIGKLSGFPRDMDEFVKFNRLQEETAWMNAEPPTVNNPQPETGDLYGDGISLEGVPSDIITGANSVLIFSRGRQKAEAEIALQLKKQYPKLSDAQIAEIMGGNE